jgi:hypothetical protein
LYTWEEFHEQEDDDGIPEISTETLWSVPEVPVSPLPWEVINRYPLLQFGEDDVAQECRVYLELERGIDPWTANYFRVRYDPENATLIFPLTDSKGGIFLLRARSIYKKNIWTISPELAGYPNLIFPKLGEVGVWFGLWLVDWTRPVISVEAEMDVMKLASMGVLNSVASATSSVTGAQIDSLSPATRLYLGYDADKAGAHAHGRIYSRLSGGQRMKYIYELDWSVASACNDPGDLESEDDLKKVLDSRKLLDK